MADKGIGFDRNIRVSWMDTVAVERLASDDVGVIRDRLMVFLETDLASREGRLKTARLLAKIWHGTAATSPAIHAEALRLFATAETAGDRIWLHYGLTVLAFPFFRDVASTVGRYTRHGDEITSAIVRQKMFADRGQIAIIEKSAERSLFLMRQLGLLGIGSKPTSYVACPSALTTRSPELETWLLAALVAAQPGGQIAADDIFRLPELFGFNLTVGLDAVRRSPLFEVQRQGSSWDLVRARAIASE